MIFVETRKRVDKCIEIYENVFDDVLRKEINTSERATAFNELNLNTNVPETWKR